MYQDYTEYQTDEKTFTANVDMSSSSSSLWLLLLFLVLHIVVCRYSILSLFIFHVILSPAFTFSASSSSSLSVSVKSDVHLNAHTHTRHIRNQVGRLLCKRKLKNEETQNSFEFIHNEFRFITTSSCRRHFVLHQTAISDSIIRFYLFRVFFLSRFSLSSISTSMSQFSE